MASASVKNSLPVTPKNLEIADFPGCVSNGVPCECAMSIRYNGPDPSSNMLECLDHGRYLNNEAAAACPRACFSQA